LPTPNAYRSVFRRLDGSHDWQTELEFGWSMVDRASVGSLAALIVEPILSDGGMLLLPDGYLKALAEHCKRRDMLLIIDEAQTAMGRCGSMFAFEQEGVVPDILTLSKGFGNGFPVSAVLTSTDIEQVCHERSFVYYATHANDPLAAAVALQVLNIITRDNLAQRAAEAGQRLSAGLAQLGDKYECIGDIRGRGLMMGMEIVQDRDTKMPSPELADKLTAAIFDLGLSIHLASMPNGGRAFRIAPPLIVSDEEIDIGLRIMDEALQKTNAAVSRSS
jgi:4-aminobutyrate aminotransferase-like enzyme